MYKVPTGIKGVARDLNRYASFTPWKADKDVIFTEAECRGVDDEIKPTYQFVRGRVEINLPVSDVKVYNV
jgi:hypothetical protein